MTGNTSAVRRLIEGSLITNPSGNAGINLLLYFLNISKETRY